MFSLVFFPGLSTKRRCRNGNGVIIATPARHSSPGQNRVSRSTKDVHEVNE